MTGPSYSRRAKTALILSPDSLGAALIGAALELVGFRATYPGEGEPAPDAIRRLKPLVLLVDVTDPITVEHASIGLALMTGAAVVFYGPVARIRDVGTLPGATQAVALALPDELDQLLNVLTAITVRQPRARRSE